MKGSISVNVVTLPEGKDPDEIIRDGQDLYHYIAEAPNWLDWTIDTWAADLDKEDTAMITAVEEKLRSLIGGLKSKALRAHYIDRAARVLSSSDKEAKSIAESWGDRHDELIDREWEPRSPQQIRTAVERRMMRIYVHVPGRRDELRPLLSGVTSPALRWLAERLHELESYCMVDLTPHSVMAVVAVAEPHYMQQVRTLIRPNVTIDDSAGVIEHLREVIG